MNPDLPHHRDVLVGLHSSARLDEILADHRNKPRLPPDAAEEFRRCFDFCLAQSALIAHYHPGVALYNVTTKSHYLMHLGMIAAFVNPSMGACWQGEDLMKVVRKMVGSCANGSKPAGALRSSIDKYARALSFEFGASGEWW